MQQALPNLRALSIAHPLGSRWCLGCCLYVLQGIALWVGFNWIAAAKQIPGFGAWIKTYFAANEPNVAGFFAQLSVRHKAWKTLRFVLHNGVCIDLLDCVRLCVLCVSDSQHLVRREAPVARPNHVLSRWRLGSR